MTGSPSLSDDVDENRPSSPTPSLLRRWFALLSAVGLVACGTAFLLPPWPRATDLDPVLVERVLKGAGFQPVRLASHPPVRTERFALSRRLVWRLAPGSELTLASVNVRRWPDFQVAMFTQGTPELYVQHRRLDWRSGVSVGQIKRHPAWQTCLVPQAGQLASPAVTSHFLNQAVNRQSSSVADRLLSLLGFGKPRERACLLVTLRSTDAQPHSEQVWGPLLRSMQGFSSAPAGVAGLARQPS